MRRRAFLSAAAGATGLAVVPSLREATATPPTVEPLAKVKMPRAADVNLDADRETAYVTTQDGFAIVDVSDPADPVVHTRRQGLLDDYEHGPLTQVRDATVDGDRMLLTAHQFAGFEEKIRGAVVLYDVGDPSNPERIAARQLNHPVHNGTIEGDVAMVTGTFTDRWPAIVLDPADGLATRSDWSVVDADPAWADVDRNIRRVHDVYLRGDTAFLAYTDAGTWELDVSDPANPTPTAHYGGRDPEPLQNPDESPIQELLGLPGNAAAARPNGDGSLLGVSKEAPAFGTSDGGSPPGPLVVWNRDTGEKAVTLSPVDRGQVRFAKNFGWRDDRLFSAWRDAGVRAFDLSNPAEPMILGEWADVGEEDFHTARPLAEGFVGLTFVGTEADERPTHLYTFPEPDGADAVPAPTGSALGGSTPTPSPTVAPPTGTSPTPERTTVQTSTTPPSTGTLTRRSTTTSADGFAIAGTVGAGLVAALQAWQRRR